VAFDRERITRDFAAAVNMTAEELRKWLGSDDSKRVGWKGADGSLRESVGHASGRRILKILSKEGRGLIHGDYAHMTKVVGFVRRHLAQEPANRVTSPWRYSLMNWGHDPLKRLPCARKADRENQTTDSRRRGRRSR
jgi:hypothetical protein